MINSFEKLYSNKQIINNITKKGYKNPTNIQKQLGQFLIQKTDIIAISKSGTGKTAAYLLPIIDNIINKKKKDFISVVILVPTKILVDQVSKMLFDYSLNCDIKQIKLTNKTNNNTNGIDIVIATPNRLNMTIKDENIDISAVETIVIDEADMVFNDGFLSDLKFIYSFLPKKTKTILLSATISQNIKYISKNFLKTYRTINISNKQDIINHIKYKAYKADKKQKINMLIHLLENKKSKCMVFFNSTKAVDDINKILINTQIPFVIYHGDLDFKQRQKNINKFKQNYVKIMLCSNIASRGIDIDDMGLVIHYDLPDKLDDFTHRCGRTGRAGRIGEVVSLLTTNDYKKFDKITNRLKLSIKRDTMEGFELKDYQPKQKAKSKTNTKKKQKRLSAIKSSSDNKKIISKKHRTKKR
ncbi:MAG: hypothetical protein DRG11_05265 [Epsilonproteobacteria bacterium]|nr:MAG: hypothetical protein DRG11_05265 [Campylobacterota bacterium]